MCFLSSFPLHQFTWGHKPGSCPGKLILSIIQWQRQKLQKEQLSSGGNCTQSKGHREDRWSHISETCKITGKMTLNLKLPWVHLAFSEKEKNTDYRASLKELWVTHDRVAWSWSTDGYPVGGRQGWVCSRREPSQEGAGTEGRARRAAAESPPNTARAPQPKKQRELPGPDSKGTQKLNSFTSKDT